MPGQIVRLVLWAGLCSLSWPATPAAAQPSPDPVPPQQIGGKVGDLIQEVIAAEVELKVTLRRSKILRSKQDIFRVAVADPSIVEVVAFGAREVEVIGKDTGSTTITLWMGNEPQAELLSVLVTVTRDRAVEDRRLLEYGELQQRINRLFPNSKIQLIPIADKLIVRGEARDEQEATEIMSIVRQHSANLSGQGADQNNVLQGAVSEPFPDGLTLPEANVISLLTVPGEKQVLLKVRIAELKRSAIRELGTDFNFDVGDFFLESILTGGGNIFATGTFDDESFELVLRVLQSNGSAKILAEPNLVVLSGHTANFISGGEFAVPTVVGVGGAQAATTTFKGFGTQVSFTPTVLDKDRVRLEVAPTFSTLNRENQVNGIFGVDTRAVETVVELREGQVLAIAGLLQEQQRGEVSNIPGLGKIPIANAVFSDKTVSRDETELLILVSPELVHAMEPENAPAILPGMEVTEPDDADFYIFGDIEGWPECHHRSTVWPLYRNRLHRCDLDHTTYQRSQAYYINGPIGLSD